MQSTDDCSPKITGEHFVSRSVLKILGEKVVRIDGTPWLEPGKKLDVGINSLTSNILCARHNAALSPLDAMAGEFFRALASVFDDLSSRKSLSRRSIRFLFSGEDIERWLVKTAFGVFHSGAMGMGGKSLKKRAQMNPLLLQALVGTDHAPQGCGLYVMRDVPTDGGLRHSIDFTPLTGDDGSEILGLRVRFAGVPLLLMLDPRGAFAPEVATYTYRPTYLVFEAQMRRHFVVLTWPERGPKNAVKFGQR